LLEPDVAGNWTKQAQEVDHHLWRDHTVLHILADNVVHFPNSLDQLLDSKEVLLVSEMSSVHMLLVGLHFSVHSDFLNVTETVEVLYTLLFLRN